MNSKKACKIPDPRRLKRSGNMLRYQILAKT